MRTWGLFRLQPQWWVTNKSMYWSYLSIRVSYFWVMLSKMSIAQTLFLICHVLNQPTNQAYYNSFCFSPPSPHLLIAKRIASFWREEAKMNKEKEPACVCTFDCFANTCGMKAGSLDRPPHNLMVTLQNHFLFTSEQHVTFGDSSPTSCLKFSSCNA